MPGTALHRFPQRLYVGIPEPHYPFHDKTVLVTCCGRICLYRKKINLSKSLAGQAVGIKEVEDGIWLVSFMHYDLGYIDFGSSSLMGASWSDCLIKHSCEVCFDQIRSADGLARIRGYLGGGNGW